MKQRNLKPTRWMSLGALVMLATVFAACGGDDGVPHATPTLTSTTPPTLRVEGEIVVFAASSLTDAFKEIGKAFESENPKATVTFNFAASSALAVQINEGAPADVFASADETQMRVVSEKTGIEDQQVFATNVPVVVVPKKANAIQSFQDLAKPGVKLVIAGKDVPIGRYARDIFAAATGASGVGADFSDKVLANVRSEEANVRGVLTKVQLGEADAGVVYTTEVAAAANDVRAIAIPDRYNVIARYPLAVLKASKRIAAARAFVGYVLSPAGQAILAKYGFGKLPAVP